LHTASAPPLSDDKHHHDVSRTATREDLEGDRFDQVELHIRQHLCQLETNLEDRIDFRSSGIGNVVEGQNRQHANTTENFQVIQQELHTLRGQTLSHRAEPHAVKEQVIKIIKS